MNFALTAGTLFGLPAGIGNALGLSGAAGQAVGQGLLTTGTKLGGGESLSDALKAGLIGGGLVYGGAQLGDYIKANTPIDASNMTSAQFNDALEGKLVADMQSAGLSKDQISAFLDDMGIGQGVVTNVATPTTDVSNVDTVNITGAKAPATLNNVLDTISTVPTLNVTATKPQQVSQDILDAVTTQLVSNQSAIPTVNVTAQKPTTVNDVIAALATTGLVANVPTVSVTSNRPITSKDDLNSVISSLVTTGTVAPTTTIPEVKITATKPSAVGDALAAVTTIPTTLTTPTTTTPDKPKETDPIKVAQLALATAGLLGAGSVLSNNGTGTQFPIVPVPAEWGNPPKPSVAPYSPLAPINFGNRNLLIGTQWEKFLNPNYGQVPEPVQYSQPSNLSYNDLMGILGSKQGMPSRSSLSINDVISGIQNQYGQTPTRTMG
jgi:DNA-binding transcriptional regulator YhcF (GntR family)